EAVAVEVVRRVNGVRRARVIPVDAGRVDPPGRLVDGAQGDAVLGIRVQRAFAGAAERVERVDRDVTGGAQVGLVGDVGEAELVGSGQHVAGRLGIGVEAQDLQLLFGG